MSEPTSYSRMKDENAALRAKLAALKAGDVVKDAALFRKLLSYQYWHRQELVRHDDVRKAINDASNQYRDKTAAPGVQAGETHNAVGKPTPD